LARGWNLFWHNTELMKKNFTTQSIFTLLLVIAMLSSLFSTAQNLLKNSTLSEGSSNWTHNSMKVEINPESVYGGTNRNNQTAEIDAEVGLRQKVSTSTGKGYQFAFKAFRRVDAATPSPAGIKVTVTGDVTGKKYIDQTFTYTNTSFRYTNTALYFGIPPASKDLSVTVEIIAHNNTRTYGVIVDDVQLNIVDLVALPVSWGQFTGTVNQNQADLMWTTQAELNNRYFVIERSVNGGAFDSVGTVPAAGNRSTYRFADKNIPAGTLQYRLRQVDENGMFSLSRILVLKNTKSADAVKLFPAQTNSSLTLSLQSANRSQASVKIRNAQGVTVQQSAIVLNEGMNSQLIQVSQLPAGVYFLTLETATELVATQKFIKTN
jgi:hypothetical protein